MTRSLVLPFQVIRLKPKFPSLKNIFYRWIQYDLLKLLNLLNLLSVLCNYIHALVWSFTWPSPSILSNSSRIISLWEKIGAHLSDLCPMTICAKFAWTWLNDSKKSLLKVPNVYYLYYFGMWREGVTLGLIMTH